MKSPKLVALLLSGAAALGVAPVAGCVGEAYVVETSPPPPREEVVVYRPGYIWVQGHWVRDGGDWRWRRGHYERERANHVYVHGRWERRGRQHVWVDGGWRARANITIR